jgi:DinB family protein
MVIYGLAQRVKWSVMVEEAWLRGPIPGVDPLIAPVLYTFTQAREDLARYTEGLTADQLWSSSVGFHVRHISRSTDRLIAYLQGRMPKKLGDGEPGASREELLAELDNAFNRAEGVVRSIDPATLRDPREVGRKRLPTTVIGLLTHIAEHIQRHVGQAITARQERWGSPDSKKPLAD